MSQDLQETFSLEAVRAEAFESFPSRRVFRHVLSMPVACPVCNERWILLADAPVALEIELGLVGKPHLDLLSAALSEGCLNRSETDHFRTDGKQVWVPDAQLQSDALQTVSITTEQPD